MRKKWIIAVLAAALLALPGVGVNLAQAAPAYTGWAPAVDLPDLHPAGYAAAGIKGKYLAGDVHNHTPFSDGTPSASLLIGKAMQQLDWFAQSGHGGKFARDGRYSDTDNGYGDGDLTGEGKFLDKTVGIGVFKGDLAKAGTSTYTDKNGNSSGPHQNMWRWQSIQSYLYPVTWANSMNFNKPIWAGFEWQVPGHEHCSAGCIDGQFNVIPGRMGNANAMAQFEYLFDMEDNDMSEGGGQGWKGKIANPPKTGTDVGIQGHAKAVAACAWMEKYHKLTSYLLFTHTERKGSWNKDLGGNNTGYNIEHFRDFNNVAPDVCFGFETMPGHQAQTHYDNNNNPINEDRGGYGTGVFGGGTYGGTGYYAAKIGYIWDAMLSEGRNWWLFGSSDFHSRAVAEYESSDYPATDANHPDMNIPIQRPATLNSGWRGALASKADFWPGEYQKDYVFVKSLMKPTPQAVLNGMRSGNSFVVQGDLIRDLDFTIKGPGLPANMGEKLTIGPRQKLTLKIRVRVPFGNDKTNNCPYTFNNPSLAQKQISQPLNQPVLDHIDLICGQVTGKIKPGDANYTNPVPQYTPAFGAVAPTVQHIFLTDMKNEGNGWYSFNYTFTPKTSCYFRLRGTNMPLDTPNETDADGNPLIDSLAHNIHYTKDGVDTVLDADVAAWSDLWFYSNPIFIRMVADPNGTVNF
jgi:hypothetical protein